MSSASPDAPHSAGLRRDMEVLKELASDECLHRSGLGVVRIAERLGREKSQVSRALRALEAEGLVVRDPRTRLYQLGWGLYTLAARGIETRLVRTATTHVHRLADEQQADARLCVLVSAQVLTLIAVPPDGAARAECPTQTPCGSALTFGWSEAGLRELITPGGSQDDPLTYHDFLARSARTHEDGYAYQPGAEDMPARYAAPVRDFRGVVLAAIQLAERPGDGPALNAIPANKAVVEAADALSADLGFQK